VADSSDTRQGATLRDFLSVLFRRKWIVLVLVAATVAIMLRLTLNTAPVYESYSKILVSRGQFTTAFAPNLKLLTWEEELTSELEAVRSARIYKRAQEILAPDSLVDAKGNPYVIDPARITASIPGKSSVIQINYRGADPEQVRRTVQALTRSYEEFRTETRVQDPSEQLQKQIDDLDAELSLWEQRRSEYLTQEGSVELPQERLQLLTERRTVESDLSTAEALVAEKEARVLWTRQLLHGDTLNAAGKLYAFGDTDERGESILTQLRKMLLNTEAEYYDARSQYTEGHPKVLALKERLDQLRAALDREGEAYLSFISAQLEAARAHAQSLQSSLDYLDQRLGRFPDREAQLARFDRAIGSLTSTHDALVKREGDALSNRIGSSPFDVVVLQDAVEAYRVRGVDRVRLAVIPIFALLVAIGLAFLVDNLDPSFKEVREVEAQLKVPMLGEVRRFRR
jgi:polysaccharide biosynthesis transport protein